MLSVKYEKNKQHRSRGDEAMKVILSVWIVSAGIGTAYSIVSERSRQIILLKTMEYTMGQLAYYMYQWHLPVEETLKKIIEEENQVTSFIKIIYQKICDKESAALGEVWQEKSRSWLKNEKLPEDMKVLWTGLFLHMPMEPKGVYDKLLLKQEELTGKRKELELKYKNERRLVLAMGFFASTFLCLILW